MILSDGDIRKELAALREEGEITPAMVFQDPYMLDFLELADTFSEKDLESAILREIERFLMELGAGFAFVEGLAYAEDRFQLVGMRCEHLLVDDRVGLAKDLAPLTVPDNHILDEKLS